ncbi:MAG: DNA-binding protein [Firmicutes bacterium]|nr:DNA-binding protein [Bacillota bacterium]
MKTLAVRLTGGSDLKLEIIRVAIENKIQAAVVLSSAGSLKKADIRLAGAELNLCKQEPLEIISINGTIAKDGLHLHLAFSDLMGNVYGGHMQNGCIIDTTCELVIGILDEYEFSRVVDDDTGYKELAISPKGAAKKEAPVPERKIAADVPEKKPVTPVPIKKPVPAAAAKKRAAIVTNKKLTLPNAEEQPQHE